MNIKAIRASCGLMILGVGLMAYGLGFEGAWRNDIQLIAFAFMAAWSLVAGYKLIEPPDVEVPKTMFGLVSAVVFTGSLLAMFFALAAQILHLMDRLGNYGPAAPVWIHAQTLVDWLVNSMLVSGGFFSLLGFGCVIAHTALRLVAWFGETQKTSPYFS